jgi:23S rRNA pseudouridine1911/1915/1917 synthase
MKLTSSDVASILQLFGQADDTIRPRFIDQLKISHPTEHTTMAAFRFQKQMFYLLADSTAEDDLHYLETYIKEDKPDVLGDFIANPKEDDLSAYALPYRGKELYLFKLKATKKRLDVYLGEMYPETSRSTWQKHVKAGHVNVDGMVVTSPKQEISGTAKVSVNVPDATDYSEDSLPILYLDDNVIVVNKPTGVLTHAKGELNDEFTVAEFFRRYSSFHLDTNRPGIIHRLDRDTSGVIIGARNPETAILLQKQFADRRTKKTYIAILDGILKEKEAHIELPIGRNPSAPSTFRVDAKGKSATTSYRVIAEDNGKSLVELRPHTGRTHQLRVHMQYLNAPVHGDRVYGKPADRLYLHAQKLEVTIPDGERKVFSAPIPAEFKLLFAELA